MALITDVVPPTQTTAPKPRRSMNRRLMVGVVVAVLLAGLAVFLWRSTSADSPVPSQVRKAVSFPVYYPKQSKLPAGYELATTSFRLAQPGVVIYSVTRGGERLIFSEEAQPDHATMDKFVKDYTPVHSGLKTDLGQAQIGAFGSGKNLRTVISLPIDKGPWLILTAPPSVSHDELVRIVQALAKG